jgi:N6-L-threonylcarbamoyladenine synthase
MDDAVGEAFDKGAKLLGLKLPGGPELEKLAVLGDPFRYSFGKVQTPGFQFSFSGLKSELARLKLKADRSWSHQDVAASYQNALISHLLQTLRRKIDELKATGRLEEVYFPSLKFCTDNAAMVGVLGYRQFLTGRVSALSEDVSGTFRTPLKKVS